MRPQSTNKRAGKIVEGPQTRDQREGPKARRRRRSLFSDTFLLASPLSNRKATCKRSQQLPTLLGQQCWELLRPCWQCCPKRGKNFEQCCDLQCIVGRIQPIRLCKLEFGSYLGAYTWPQHWIQHFCATFRRSRNKRNVGSCWLKRLTGFKLCATILNKQQHSTTCNRVRKRTQHVTSNMLRPCAQGLRTLFFVRQRGTTIAYIMR